MKKIVIAATILAMSSGTAFAASGNSSTAAGSAAAVVVAPITLTHSSSGLLNFGSFTAGAGGTVVVDSLGNGSVTSDVGFVPHSTESADGFTVTGDPSRSFAIATTAGTVTSGSNSMGFTTAASLSSGSLNVSGTGAFTVGGTLTVAAAQAAGSYTGTYNATVTYN